MAALRVYASIIQHFQTVQNQVEEFDLCTGQVDVIWTFEKKIVSGTYFYHSK